MTVAVLDLTVDEVWMLDEVLEEYGRMSVRGSYEEWLKNGAPVFASLCAKVEALSEES